MIKKIKPALLPASYESPGCLLQHLSQPVVICTSSQPFNDEGENEDFEEEDFNF